MSHPIQEQLNRLILHPSAQKWAKAVTDGNELKYPHQPQFLSPDLVSAHLEGNLTIGVMLLQTGTNTAKAGCIDIDCPRDAAELREALGLAQKIQLVSREHNLHTYIEFSGNRGWHLWLFSLAPLPGSTWISCLSNLAQAAGFDAKEVFPNHPHTENKCIKLPYAVHLKSKRRSGFIEEEVKWDESGFPLLPNQGNLMSEFVQNQPDAIVALASTVPKNQPVQKKLGAPCKAFESFGTQQHPGCIQHLISQGAPKTLDYNAVNLTLARYALARSFNESAALELAETVARATPENHPTSKDEKGKVVNFKSVYRTAKQKEYGWECSYALSGIDTHNPSALSTRGCSGENCSMWAYNYKPFTAPNKKGKLVNQAIWKAIVDLSQKGLEIRSSTILAALENIEISEASRDFSPADELIEEETLASILLHPEALAEALSLDLPSEGFISATEKSPQKHLESLLTTTLPSLDTLTHHLQRIRDKGLRIVALGQTVEAARKYRDRTLPVANTLDELITGSHTLLRRTSSEIQPMSAYSAALIEELFSCAEAALATPSQWLNNAFNGGYAPGKLYVIGAPPGGGKTTFCSWCGDFIANQKIPVLVASYEMGKHQLWCYSLARLEGLNSALIERKAWNDPNHPDPQMLQQRVARGAQRYHQEIAPYLTILECGPEHTSASLKGVIAQVRHNARLAEDAPVLVIVDYLQLMLSGDEKLDVAAAETLRVSRIATSLKQLARDCRAAVLAISDITKAAYQQALSTGSLDMSALRDSFKIAHAADVIMLLQSGKITVGKGDNLQQLDQLQLVAQKDPQKQRLLDQCRTKYPITSASKDTYARLSILKNRGGILAEPLFIYHKATHSFTPIDLDLGAFNNDEDII